MSALKFSHFPRSIRFTIFASLLSVAVHSGAARADADEDKKEDPVAAAEKQVGQAGPAAPSTSYFQKALADAGVAKSVHFCISAALGKKDGPAIAMAGVQKCISDAKLALSDAMTNQESSKNLDSGISSSQYADLAIQIGEGRTAIEEAEKNYQTAVSKASTPTPDANCTLTCDADKICKIIDKEVEKDGKKETVKEQQCVAKPAAGSSASSRSTRYGAYVSLLVPINFYDAVIGVKDNGQPITDKQIVPAQVLEFGVAVYGSRVKFDVGGFVGNNQLGFKDNPAAFDQGGASARLAVNILKDLDMTFLRNIHLYVSGFIGGGSLGQQRRPIIDPITGMASRNTEGEVKTEPYEAKRVVYGFSAGAMYTRTIVGPLGIDLALGYRYTAGNNGAPTQHGPEIRAGARLVF